MPARWNKRTLPASIRRFMERFPTEEACADFLFHKRWPHGFVCPSCGGVHGWRLESRKHTWECASCGRQTSVTAGTVMHRSRVSLRTWFLAAHVVATHSNGISALQLWPIIGVGSYKTAWLMLQKLRRSMRDPDRDPLSGIVEVDETTLPFRTASEPIGGGQGRSHQGKMLLIGAVEKDDEGRPRRIRLEYVTDYTARTLQRFVHFNVHGDALVETDAFAGYRGLEHDHKPMVVGSMAAHVLLPWVHRLFAQLKRWALGVYHGLRRHHIQVYLDEFVFRWNRRHYRSSSFERLLGLAVNNRPRPYREIVASSLVPRPPKA